MRLPTFGYHVTYLDRLSSIMEQGLRPDMPAETRTGIGLTDAVYFITSPSQAHWAANDRGLDPSEDFVLHLVLLS